MKIANKYLKRFVFFHKEEQISPLFYLFVMSNIAWVLAVAFLQGVPAVNNSSLVVALANLSAWVPTLWGWTGLAVLTGNFVTIVIRSITLSKLVAFAGFLMWTFACMAYLLVGSWVLLFAIGVPHTLFWVWYYSETLRYHRVKKEP